jgi:hypothetical protein
MNDAIIVLFVILIFCIEFYFIRAHYEICAGVLSCVFGLSSQWYSWKWGQWGCGAATLAIGVCILMADTPHP